MAAAAARGISKCDVDLREAFYSSAAAAVLIKINRDEAILEVLRFHFLLDPNPDKESPKG